MTVHLKWSVIADDIKHAAKLASSAVALTDRLCSKEKRSVWKVIGVCQCGGKIIFEVVAIWQNGSIIRHQSDLDDGSCPHCQESLSRHTTTYDRVHSHHTAGRN